MKKNNKKQNKLNFSRETLRDLVPDELRMVAAGGESAKCSLCDTEDITVVV